MANKRFTTIKNDYCITFGDQVCIELIQNGEDGKNIKAGQVFNFTPINKLQDLVESLSMVDVIGVVTDAQGISSLTTKSGDQCDK